MSHMIENEEMALCREKLLSTLALLTTITHTLIHRTLIRRQVPTLFAHVRNMKVHIGVNIVVKLVCLRISSGNRKLTTGWT